MGRLLFSGPSKVLLPRRRPVAVCFMTPRYYATGTVVSNQPAIPRLRGRRGPRHGVYEAVTVACEQTRQLAPGRGVGDPTQRAAQVVCLSSTGGDCEMGRTLAKQNPEPLELLPSGFSC